MPLPPRHRHHESQELSELEISAITDVEDDQPAPRGFSGLVGRLFRLPWVGSEPVDHDRGRELRRAVRAEDLAGVKKMLRDGVGVNQSQEASLACIATRRQNLELLQVLIEAGADLETGDRRNRASRTRTPLQEAARKGWVPGLDALLAAKVNLEAEDETGTTALGLAVRSGKHHATRHLLKAGAQPFGGPKAKVHPLHEAVTPEMGEMLMAAGADVDVRDRAGCTPLHHQARAGRVGMVEFFLSKGADIEAVDDRGRTALFFAGSKGEAQGVFRKLLAAGANTQVRDTEMNTWCHLAASRCANPKVLEWVYEQTKGQWFLKNKAGETPWDLITARGFQALSLRIKAEQSQKESVAGTEHRPEFSIFQTPSGH